MSERRRMMMVGQLPYDAEIEYLSTTGSQYINTAIAPNGLSHPIMEASITCTSSIDTVGTRYLFGSEQNGMRFGFGVARTTSGQGYEYRMGSYYTEGLTVVNNSSIIKIDGYTGKAYRNGTLKASGTANCGTSTVPIYLFAVNASGAESKRAMGVRVHSFKILDGDTLVRDMIPVRVGSIGYMYDKVSKQLFGNAGSGSFTLGPDV